MFALTVVLLLRALVTVDTCSERLHATLEVTTPDGGLPLYSVIEDNRKGYSEDNSKSLDVRDTRRSTTR